RARHPLAPARLRAGRADRARYAVRAGDPGGRSRTTGGEPPTAGAHRRRGSASAGLDHRAGSPQREALTMAVLPPGLSAAQFAGVLEELRGAVGGDWVWSSEEDLGPYRDSFSPVWDTAEERHASAAVAPADVAQVQAIVRIAGRHKVPLYPISTGKNFGYGGPSPNVTGSVVLDLKRLNQVLEVDDKRHFALVEPGVSYFDLYRHIEERGLKVMIDCPDPGWGSPIGNALERGIGYTMPQFRDHF